MTICWIYEKYEETISKLIDAKTKEEIGPSGTLGQGRRWQNWPPRFVFRSKIQHRFDEAKLLSRFDEANALSSFSLSGELKKNIFAEINFE
jgi:hypothetical protein